MAGQRKKAGPEKGSVVESRDFTYLSAGVYVDPYEGNEPTLDPDLEKARDDEAKKLAEVPTGVSREDITIAPELVEARKKELERGTKSATASTATDSEGGDKPAKKTAAKKSSK